MRFQHDTLAQRIRFHSHHAAEELAAEVAEIGARRVMVIAAATERETAERVTAAVPVARWHDEVAMHVPEPVAVRARAAATDGGADLLVSVGGGSTTGLAKAVALTTGLPIVAVPTTYAGSEATNVWGITDDNRKTTGVDARVLPRAIIYDAALTLSLPVDLSVASGLNAVAHCVDSMWAPRSDPIDRAIATEGIRALHEGIPQIIADPTSLPGRENTLYGAYLAAVAFSSAGSGLHHKICHVLGGMFDLPHAQTHAVVLPHVMAFNGPAAPEALRRIAGALGAADAINGLADFAAETGTPTALRALGMPESGIEPAARATLAVAPSGNPRPVDEAGLIALLSRAWRGDLQTVS
jgi:alcohol dehydrogenase class IV